MTDTAPDLNLHGGRVYTVDAGDRVVEALAFRDYLRAHPATAAEYEQLKRRLAHEHRFDREAYTEAKRPFITRMTALALES